MPRHPQDTSRSFPLHVPKLVFPPYLVIHTNGRGVESHLHGWVCWLKKKHNMNVASYVFFTSLTEDSSPGTSLSDDSEGLFQRGKGRYIAGFDEEENIVKHQKMTYKNRHIRLMIILVSFCVWENARVWNHFSCASSLSWASIWFPASQVRLTRGSCSNWWLDNGQYSLFTGMAANILCPQVLTSHGRKAKILNCQIFCTRKKPSLLSFANIVLSSDLHKVQETRYHLHTHMQNAHL